MTWRPNSAMILGAGLGKRMRPLTDSIPKPMVPFMGEPMIDHIMKRLDEAGIEQVVVNVHYLADILETHLSKRTRPVIMISDERRMLMDTGGGVSQALPLLGDGAFLIHNSDSMSLETEGPNLDHLARHWREGEMDTLLLLAPTQKSIGYYGRGDFIITEQGQITRPDPGETAPFVFTGISLASPRLFHGAPQGPFSLNRLWTRAIAEGRAFGLVHKGLWSMCIIWLIFSRHI